MPRKLFYPLEALLVLFGLYNAAVLWCELEKNSDDTGFIAALSIATAGPLALAGGVAKQQWFSRRRR